MKMLPKDFSQVPKVEVALTRCHYNWQKNSL